MKAVGSLGSDWWPLADTQEVLEQVTENFKVSTSLSRRRVTNPPVNTGGENK